MNVKELKDLIKEAINKTDGTARDVMCYLSGYYYDSNPELSKFCEIVIEETRESDFKKHTQDIDNAVISVLSHKR
jgi:hypothetical protein